MAMAMNEARDFILDEFLYYSTSDVRSALSDEINRAFDEHADDVLELRAELRDIADYYFDEPLDVKLAIHKAFD